ncbi:hypothetical protein OMO38_10405 [Chryseobacterium sp. 09-1422]|uniref:Uncharacterized protein n=1 Tax=Chryseobacterium kimseyorum TaxID=2984028 RepID=A0ABT3HYT6_9FLAO|nr:hypothetical protein [Chryseobacterium kimseyorum]MCW3168933.1 hypothetical protein [Chryseobacterium kimseyorum]
MALKKRKTPLHVLFGEREALKNKSNMTTISIIPVSGIAIDQMVKIDNHSYQYKGQQTVKRNGIKKTVYQFKGVSTSVDKEFNVTKAPTFKMVNSVLKMN